ncbi:hypothetical protein [Nocardiopsis sp. NRRL B-16309]|uniref:hypothetical protein n=1 Tax=Nocardiopsis sp. NRRL B-16309 TaxID=1519494 RepID=UPI0006ADC6AC|nr:hypothetical protein [Nocardiopsis sp. NRRL B-16309]KOX23601.1 hypothetical protein ADL05_02460 [Nocardiopsis sp. NRRL B-16309]
MDAHSTTLLFHNTMRITDGHLEEFRAAVRRAVDFTREHGPQLMVEVFLDEERMLAHSFQLYAGSESVLLHWKLSDPYIQGVMEHCRVRAFEVYGEPSQAVLDGLGPARADFPVSVHPRMAGFTRPLGTR